MCVCVDIGRETTRADRVTTTYDTIMASIFQIVSNDFSFFRLQCLFDQLPICMDVYGCADVT